MQEFLSQLNQETEALLVLSIILFAGFIMTRLTNTLNLPKVSGYILAGILIGPCCLDFIPGHMIESMGFVSDLALAFIAFGVGKFFKKEVLMKTGKKIIVITISEALTAGVLVTIILKFMFRLDWDFALILGAIATATAPASTMMTINQYKAKGEFVNTLLQIVALDDVVCLLAFSIVAAIANGRASGALSVNDILIPILLNLFAIFLGFFCGYFLSRLLIPARSRDNRLILAIAMLLGLSGICAAVDISPLLSCMVFGAAYINLTRDKKLFRQINNFTPPVMSIFFIVSGMNLDVFALKTVGVIGVSYFLIRIAGKYMGTYFSCMVMGTSREIRKYMGLALIPQAGVAIGLAFLGQRLLPPETGNLMLTIILSSSVLYEMVGPVSAKAALFLSGSIAFKKDPDKEAKIGIDASVDILEKVKGLPVDTDDTWEEPEDDADVEEGTGGAVHKKECEKNDGIFLLCDDSTEREAVITPNFEAINDTAALSVCFKKKEENDAASEGCDCTTEDDEAEEYDEVDEHDEEHDDLADGVLEELREYVQGVDERDDYDIEKEVKPVKRKKKKKQGKKNKKIG